jgi:hypothetical protein
LSGALAGQAPAAQEEPTQEQRDRAEEIRQLLRSRQLLPEPETSETAARRQEAAARRQEEQRIRLTALAGMNECAMPDGTTHPVNRTVTFLGWKYQCVEVRDASLVRSGVGWTRLPEAEQEPIGR